MVMGEDRASFLVISLHRDRERFQSYSPLIILFSIVLGRMVFGEAVWQGWWAYSYAVLLVFDLLHDLVDSEAFGLLIEPCLLFLLVPYYFYAHISFFPFLVFGDIFE